MGAPRPWSKSQVVAICARYRDRRRSPEYVVAKTGLNLARVEEIYAYLAWLEEAEAVLEEEAFQVEEPPPQDT